MAGLGARHRRKTADEAFVRRLFDEHGNAMLTYATRLTGDRGVAEEVFQEVLVRAWRHPGGMANGKCWTRKWLLGMVDTLVRGSDGTDPSLDLPDPALWRNEGEQGKGSGKAHVYSSAQPEVAMPEGVMPEVRLDRPWRLTGVTRRRW